VPTVAADAPCDFAVALADEVRMRDPLTAPFPWFGGKRTIADEVWTRFGTPTQYIEPFCGSAAMLLGATKPASLEVIGDQNFYVANFWRCVKFQPSWTAAWADYPVSHVDLDARHRWLTDPTRTAHLIASLADPEWIGDAQMAGWWVWGQCCWIGSGWCDTSQIPHVSDAGRGVQSKIPHVGNAGLAQWVSTLAARLAKVRIIHGDWSRCLNHHYGGDDTAIFFDPPYRDYESLYAAKGHEATADAVADWCRYYDGGAKIALCGHAGDYELPTWTQWAWSRGRLTYNGGKTTDEEVIWFSPSCERNLRLW
jgi:hypothetical protein